MTDPNLNELHDFLVAVAKRAGDMITSARPQMSASGTKKNSADIVTETDQAVEKMVIETARERYPDLKVMGEETYKPGDKLTADPTLIVDPIDGTTNFLHAYPYVSISLGVAIDLKPVVGVVYNPFTETLYSGIDGQGSFITDRFHDKVRLPLIEPEPLAGLDSALIAVEWGSDRSGNDHAVKVFWERCSKLCAVAAGNIDIYWEAGCWAWDVCAGWVILKEAGGIIVDANKGNWHPRVDERRYMAVRKGRGQREIVEEFWDNVQGTIEVGR